MKKLLLSLILLTSIVSYSQTASRLLNTQTAPQPISAPNLMWVDTCSSCPTGMNRMWVAATDSLKLIYRSIAAWYRDSTTNVARRAMSVTTTGLTGSATFNPATGVFNIPNYASAVYYHNGSIVSGLKVLTFTGSVAGGAGNVVLYLTDNGAAGGNALFTNVNYVNPLVNNSTQNFTFGWTISGDLKTLTVNVKGTPQINVAVLSLTLLGVPANAANGTGISCLVMGS